MRKSIAEEAETPSPLAEEEASEAIPKTLELGVDVIVIVRKELNLS